MIPGISQRAAPDKAKLKKWMLLHFPGREMRGVAAEAGATLTNNARQLLKGQKDRKDILVNKLSIYMVLCPHRLLH